MTQTLSSRWTLVQKWIFPLIWSLGFGFITLQMFWHPETFVYNGVRGGAGPSARILFSIVWLATTVFAVAAGWRMKRVRVDGADLLISNYLSEIRVPLADVRAVNDRYVGWFTLVSVDFVAPTSLGGRVAFLAPWHLFRRNRPREVPEELRRLVAETRGRQLRASDSVER